MRRFLTLAVLATLVVACSSGDSPTDENGDGDDAGFAARIDGQNWSATMIIGARADEVVISGTTGLARSRSRSTSTRLVPTPSPTRTRSR
jgi:hypothetical protein